MQMYNLLYYSQNYSMTSGSLWSYHRDEINIDNDNAWDGNSFKYKARGKMPARPGNEGDTSWPPVPTLNVKSLSHLNI